MEWIVEAESLSDFVDHGRYTLSTKPLIRCKDCLMHGVCRYEQGLGADGYCSQAERIDDE